MGIRTALYQSPGRRVSFFSPWPLNELTELSQKSSQSQSTYKLHHLNLMRLTHDHVFEALIGRPPYHLVTIAGSDQSGRRNSRQNKPSGAEPADERQPLLERVSVRTVISKQYNVDTQTLWDALYVCISCLIPCGSLANTQSPK